MIQFIDGNEVQRRMNELASANKKFIFAIDYKKEKGFRPRIPQGGSLLFPAAP